MTLKEVVNDPDKKMGHAFVLFAILEAMDRVKEEHESQNKYCEFCNKRTINPTVFYQRDNWERFPSLRVACSNCKKEIDPFCFRRE